MTVKQIRADLVKGAQEALRDYPKAPETRVVHVRAVDLLAALGSNAEPPADRAGEPAKRP